MREILLAVLAVLASTSAASERLTQSCNTSFGANTVTLYGANDQVPEIAAIANDPARDPALHERLWSPKRAWHGMHIFDPYVTLEYDRAQDVKEIAAALGSDPVLASRRVTRAFASGFACFAAAAPASPIKVTEYHNRALNHYFLSSSAAENALIDSGAAGEGWERTGESFDTIATDYCHGAYPVFRFYGPLANSHFFTVDAGECGQLRNRDPGWAYEGFAFGAMPATGGVCPERAAPVYRLYNNRWMFNDSNHRFVTRVQLYEEMKARGWAGEGVAFCVPS